MFYQVPPSPVYLTQANPYETCRQEQINRQLQTESTSPFRQSIGRRIGQIIDNELTALCYEKIREDRAKQQQLQQKKETERLSAQYKKTHPVAFQMGEYFGGTHCKILASNPEITTWEHLNYLSGFDNKMVEIGQKRQSMIYHAQTDLQARQDFESFSLGLYTKQSYYRNCQERIGSLTLK